MEIGKWLKINGEAIYGTTRWKEPFQWNEGKRDYLPPKVDGFKTGGDIMLKLTENPEPGYAIREVFFTQKGKTVYAIFPSWPKNGKVLLRDISLKGKSVTLLETGQQLSYTAIGKGSEIILPVYDPNKMKSEYAYVIKID